ncbi:hypothetical protein KAR91_75545 [Candidatus Pacearchaeota archaeon]|nr:hypothetical protein [Candidatus Pacearchaeota archaeon]
MNIKETLSIVSGILILIGMGPYIIEIIRCKTRPAKASWIIWAILDYLILFGMVSKGAFNWQIAAGCITSTVILILSIRLGEPGWSKLDKFCLLGAGMGITLWLTSGDGIFGVIAGTSLTIIGSFPTFASVKKNPENESGLAWSIFMLSGVLSVAAVPSMNPSEILQPTSYLIVSSTVMYFLFLHQKLAGPKLVDLG